MSDQVSKKFNNPAVYQTYVGRWSALAARQFVSWLGVAPGNSWLDVGAGTGMLTQVILEQADPTGVTGIDPSAHYVEYAKTLCKDDRAQFIVGEVGELISNPSRFDVAVAGLVLNFVPSHEQTVSEMKTLVKSSGMVAAYVWDYAENMQMMRHFWDAAARIDPASSEYDSGKRFTWCNPDGLRQLFESRGLVNVETRAIDVAAHFDTFDDYWQPFLAAQGSISTYLNSLDEKTLEAIRDELVSDLPIAETGTIDLINRAWAVKSYVP